jgi:hypothetical protein
MSSIVGGKCKRSCTFKRSMKRLYIEPIRPSEIKLSCTTALPAARGRRFSTFFVKIRVDSRARFLVVYKR